MGLGTSTHPVGGGGQAVGGSGVYANVNVMKILSIF